MSNHEAIEGNGISGEVSRSGVTGEEPTDEIGFWHIRVEGFSEEDPKMLSALLQAAVQGGISLNSEQLNTFRALKLEEIRPQVETGELGVEDIVEVLKLCHGADDVTEVSG